MFLTHWIGIKPLEYLTLPFRKKIQGDQTTIDSIISYVKARSKNLDSHYIYFDRGTEGLDSAYEDAQNQIDLIFESERLDYKSLVFEGRVTMNDFGQDVLNLSSWICILLEVSLLCN